MAQKRHKLKKQTKIQPYCINLQNISLAISHYCCCTQSPSHVQLSTTPWTAACQASLSLTISQSLPKFMSVELVMPSNYLILCCPLLLLPSLGCGLCSLTMAWPLCGWGTWLLTVSFASTKGLGHSSRDPSALPRGLELVSLPGTVRIGV